MTICVVSHPGKDASVRFNATKEGVATRAEQTPNSPRRVAVVDEQCAFNGANHASPHLGRSHCLHLFRSQAVLALQPGPCILSPGRIWIAQSPLPKPLIPSFLVGLPIFARPRVTAILAVGTQFGAGAITRLCEPFFRETLGAHRACFHSRSIAVKHGSVCWNQPCHADVLLELANGGTT